MKKHDLLSLLYLLAVPIGLILVGAVVAIAPDVLTALISRFLGWAMLLIGVGGCIAAMFSSRFQVRKLFWPLFLLGVGRFLIRNPLFVGRGAGIFLGLMLTVQGIREVWQSTGKGRPLGIVLTAVGVILMLCPMAASRIVFSLCGVAMVIVGIVMGLDTWKNRRYLEGGDDPNIIDAL